MFYRLSVLGIELVSLYLFIRAIVYFSKYDQKKAVELFCGFLYGLLLEELDIYFFRTYHYGPGFLFQLGQAPLAIAWLWSLILSSSMAISDRLGVKGWAKPFLDGLLALLIDIGVDAVAIRIGYWKWKIPLSEGWFGVPAGNLYAWMWVAFSYSFTTRLVRKLAEKEKRRAVYQWLAPFFSYLLLFAQIAVVGITGVRLGILKESQKLWVFYLHVVIFSGIVTAGWRGRKPAVLRMPAVLMGSRFAIHLYFIAAMFFLGIGQALPLLAVVSLAAVGLELWLKISLEKSSSCPVLLS